MTCLDCNVLGPQDLPGVIGCGFITPRTRFRCGLPKPQHQEEDHGEEITYIPSLAVAKLSWTFANHLYPVMCLRNIQTVMGIRGDRQALSQPLASTLGLAYSHPNRRNAIASAYCVQADDRKLCLYNNQGIFLGNPGETVIVTAFVNPSAAHHVLQLANAIRAHGGVPRAVVAIFCHGVDRKDALDLLGVPNLYYIADVKG